MAAGEIRAKAPPVGATNEATKSINRVPKKETAKNTFYFYTQWNHFTLLLGMLKRQSHICKVAEFSLGYQRHGGI